MAELNECGLVLDGVFHELPGLRILQGVYLRVEPASVCALFGRNGCGKTTLLKVATGQVTPASGLLIVDGERFHSKARRRRFSRIAYLPQQSMLPGDITVRRLLHAFDAEQLESDEVIETVRSHDVERLSGGERRYLELSLVLSLERSYAILDEPFTGVAPQLIDRMTQRIRAAAERGAGILLTDHYHHYTLPIADRAYLMADRQCRPLDADQDLRKQLADRHYLSA